MGADGGPVSVQDQRNAAHHAEHDARTPSTLPLWVTRDLDRETWGYRGLHILQDTTLLAIIAEDDVQTLIRWHGRTPVRLIPDFGGAEP